MYGKLGSTTFLAMPAGAVAVGGLDVLWYVVAGCTLLACVLAMERLLPRRVTPPGRHRARPPRA